METVTLLHTRWPKDEFIYEPSSGENIDEVDNLSDDERAALYRTTGRPITASANRKRISGTWGTMMMIVGDHIDAAQFDFPVMGPLLTNQRREVVTLNCRPVHLLVTGSVTSTKEFTTVERYRTDDGRVNQWDFGYVRLVSRERPYGLRTESGNSVVKTLRPGHDGACIRVLGGETAQQRAILIHEAPHVGWVVGCIGPRPFGDRAAYSARRPGNPSDITVREIIREMNRRGGKGSLFVLRG
jgi:hypothetical protein